MSIDQPYVGPIPFEEKDSKIFFGRFRETNELVSLIKAHNIVIVHAESGAGKTSLLNAALIPKLREENFEVLPIVRVGIDIPVGKRDGLSDTNIYVFNTLMQLAENEYDVSLAKMTFSDFLKKRGLETDINGKPLSCAIIFDQFEELFTSYQENWKDREKFFEQIAEAVKDKKNQRFLRIVFIIRDDYIAQLEPYAHILPENFRIRYHIERLHRKQALKAVTEPLTIEPFNKRSFAKGVAEVLVDELLKVRVETSEPIKGEFAEPVTLQVVCERLWKGLPPNVIKITDVQVRKYLDEALPEFYNDILEVAAREYNMDEKYLRKWCEEKLITSIGTRGSVYMTLKSTDGIPNKIIEFLIDKHLIRRERRAGARWIELSHDKFIDSIRFSNRKYFFLDAEKEEKQMRAIQAMTKAEHAWEAKDHKNALKFYDEALNIYEDIGDFIGGANALVYIGRIHQVANRYDEAIEYFRKALEKNPEYIEARILLEESEKHIITKKDIIHEIKNQDRKTDGGYKPQYYPGNTSVATNRRKHMSDDVEKLRDISDEDLTAILGHRAPGADYPSTHPPLAEIGEPECPVREVVEPTPGAAAGDRIRYSQFSDSMYNAPSVPYWRSYHAAINFRGVDPGTLSGRQVNEMRERDMEEYTRRQAETEITDWGLAGLRGCTVHGHSLRLQEDGTMFDMLDRRRLEGGVIVMDKDQVGVPIDRKVNLGKPMSEAEAAKKTTIYRVDNIPFRSDKEVIEHVQRVWELRTTYGFQPKA